MRKIFEWFRSLDELELATLTAAAIPLTVWFLDSMWEKFQ